MFHTIVLLSLCVEVAVQNFSGELYQKADTPHIPSLLKFNRLEHIIINATGNVTLEVTDQSPQNPPSSPLIFFPLFEISTLRVMRNSPSNNMPAEFRIRKPPKSLSIFGTNLTYNDKTSREPRIQTINFSSSDSNVTLENIFNTNVNINASESQFRLVNCSILKLEAGLTTQSAFKTQNTTIKELNIAVMQQTKNKGQTFFKVSASSSSSNNSKNSTNSANSTSSRSVKVNKVYNKPIYLSQKSFNNPSNIDAEKPKGYIGTQSSGNYKNMNKNVTNNRMTNSKSLKALGNTSFRKGNRRGFR